MTPFSPTSCLAACAALAVVSNVQALAPNGLKSRITSISHHGQTGEVSFSQSMSRAEVLASVEDQLMTMLMDDPSIGDTIKDILKSAMHSVVSSLSETARESCDRIAQKAEEEIEDAAVAKESIDALLENLDAEAEDSSSPTDFATQSERISYLHLSSRAGGANQADGFFDSLKEKTQSAFGKMKEAAGHIMIKISDSIKPILEKAIAKLLPKLQMEAQDLMVKACSFADKKLAAIEDKFQ